MLMKIYLKKMLTKATKLEKLKKRIHSTRPVKTNKTKKNNNPTNTTAPVISKIKKIKSNLMCTTSDKGNKNWEEIRTQHGKPVNISAQIYFNSETESDPSYAEDNHYLSKNHHFDDDMEYFKNKTVQFLQKLHFLFFK